MADRVRNFKVSAFISNEHAVVDGGVMKVHYAKRGRTLCQIENTTRRMPPVAASLGQVTCKNCHELGSRTIKLKPKPSPIREVRIHFQNDSAAWCLDARSGESVTQTISAVDCDDCLRAFRRRLGAPQARRAVRRTG